MIFRQCYKATCPFLLKRMCFYGSMSCYCPPGWLYHNILPRKEEAPSLNFQIIKEYKNRYKESRVLVDIHFVFHCVPYQIINSLFQIYSVNRPCREGDIGSGGNGLTFNVWVWAPHGQDTQCSQVKVPDRNCGWSIEGHHRNGPYFAEREISLWLGTGSAWGAQAVQISLREGFSSLDPCGVEHRSKCRNAEAHKKYHSSCIPI